MRASVARERETRRFHDWRCLRKWTRVEGWRNDIAGESEDRKVGKGEKTKEKGKEKILQ